MSTGPTTLRRALSTVIVALGGLALEARAETVYRVAALGGVPVPPPVATPPDTVEIGVLGSRVLFSAATKHVGLELWITDGSERGTTLVADIYPGVESSDLKAFTTAGDTAYFIADDGSHGYELWCSDGTPAGTTIVRDVCPGPCDGMPFRWLNIIEQKVVAAAGSAVVFVADDGVHGRELWRSDGTQHGTFLLADLLQGAGSSSPERFVSAGDRAFFQGGGDAGTGLWVTDGTASGTRFVSEHGPFVTSSGATAWTGSRFYFLSQDVSSGVELWSTDGTPEGTSIVADICPGECSSGYAGGQTSSMTALQGVVYFVASRPDIGSELWRTDGTSAGTTLVGDFNPGPASGVWSVAATSDRLFVVVSDESHGAELWVSDGTAPGSHLIADYCPGRCGLGASRFTPAGELMYFTALRGIWRSDGSLRGTGLIIPTGASGGYWSVLPLGEFARKLLLVISDEAGRNLWLSDGTRTGSGPITTGGFVPLELPGSYPSKLVPMAGGLAFTAGQPQPGLWYTDPAPGSTVSLSPSGSYVTPTLLTPVGTTLFFSQGTYGLWKTDLAGRTPTQAYNHPPWTEGPQAAAALGDSLLVSDVLDQGQALYRLAAGASMPQLVKDLCTDGCSDQIDSMTPFRERILFTGVHFGSSEGGLWITDGTTAGTVELTRLGTAAYSPGLDQALAVGSTWTYFTAARASTGTELWLTDGTASGTRIVADVCRGRCSGVSPPVAAWASGRRQRSVTAGTDRLFFVADDGTHGSELWVTDGTPESTRMVADLTPGGAGSAITWVTGAAGGAFFAFDDGEHGRELWFSSGTAEGTSLVEDINPGLRSSEPRHLLWTDDVLLFAASDGAHGLEPWRSDGTPAGTRLLADIVPGPGSSSPEELVRSDRHVYFRALDLTAGFELWAAELDGNARWRRRLPRS